MAKKNKKKSSKPASRYQICSVTVSRLQLALLDFAAERMGGSDITRSVLVRRAIESYVLGQELWDADEFRRYSSDYSKTIPDEDDRQGFLSDVEWFLKSPGGPRPSGDPFSELADIEIETRPGIFKL